MNFIWRIGCLGVVMVMLAACDVGHSMVADNRTDTAVLARLTGASAVPSVHRISYVVIVPARTRLVIAEQPFAGDQIEEVEILTNDCRSVADFRNMLHGALFVINNGPTAEQRDEYPSGSPTAERTTQCASALPWPPAY